MWDRADNEAPHDSRLFAGPDNNMTKRQAYELGYDRGTSMNLMKVAPRAPDCVPKALEVDYQRGIDHAIEDRMS